MNFGVFSISVKLLSKHSYIQISFLATITVHPHTPAATFYVFVHVCMPLQVMWQPEVNIGVFLHGISTLDFEARSLTEPGTYHFSQTSKLSSLLESLFPSL